MRVFIRLASFLLFSSTVLLSGCAHLNSQFDCPMRPGVMCKSVDQINTMVNQGQLGHETETVCPECEKKSYAKVSNAYATPSLSNTDNQASSQEMTLRVWLAPYQDNAGTLTASRFFYTHVAVNDEPALPINATTEQARQA